MAGVKFENVYKIYDEVTVIENFSMEIHNQEFLVLVGPSGCGKSTTLRMIAGLEEVSRGDLFIGERRVNDVHPRDRNIAMVFQNYALYPHMSVEQNMGFSLRLQKVSRAEINRKVADVAEILGLQDLLKRKPKQLSGGQRQRVAMGRAIVRDPQVFLFDEPLSNLDAKLRVQMRVELAKLHKRLQTTIVYVTHDQVEAMTLADRIVVMKDGLIQQVGTPLELYERPGNAFVGGFIGSPAMNQVAATISKQDGQLAISGNEFSLPAPAAQSESLAAYVGQEVLLGIRPEHLQPKAAANDAPALSAEIEVIEPMGGESYVYFTLEKQQWVARCEGTPEVVEGKTAAMVVDLEKMHIFTRDGQSRIA